MYTLKSIVQRSTALGTAVAVLAATVLPTGVAFADALNPLTERSLLLSSSAPGYTDTDGSGNAETIYSPPGSGPNGKKTGETFTFKVSTDSVATNKPIKAFTLQYCTNAAGNCQAPGDNMGDARDNLPTAREDNVTAHANNRSDLDVVGSWTNGSGAGQFDVLIDGTPAGAGDWTMSAINAEDTTHSGNLTGKNNMIQLTHADEGISPTGGQQIQIVFRASTASYITNPGSGSFFVKINTYATNTAPTLIPAVPAVENTNIIDGGVTVANVMTESIHITTKVLETMAFSVGTKNRDTKVIDCAFVDQATTPDCEGEDTVHGTCDPIEKINGNRLNLGNPDAEYSLETGKAWDVYSYWRLSSNSSGGATVYYSGDTLSNTVGDQIAEVGATKAVSTPGTEQFGLAFVGSTYNDTLDPAFQALIDGVDDRYNTPSTAPFNLTTDPASAQYNEGEGLISDDDGNGPNVPTAKFAFKRSSLTVPEVIAQQNENVISCATAKMRYVANIGADTPAGVYTTKINYLAAPQY